MELVVGLGEYAVTDREEDVIRTFALASCVGVTVYSPVRKAAGMLHVVLPYPLDDKDVEERPGYYATTGIPLLINAMCQRYGCRKGELQIQLFGGADSTFDADIYKIGEKNIEAVKYTLLNMELAINKADLRGNESRTLEMDVKTGTVKVLRRPL